MASAAHVYGKPILGAEAFTADRRGEVARAIRATSRTWATGRSARASTASCSTATRCSRGATSQPGMPWGPGACTTSGRRPGGSSPRPWHEYLARCQYLLQQGLFVADICYPRAGGLAAALQRRRPRRQVAAAERPGYNFDGCPPEVVLTRMTVQGRPARAARRHELPRAGAAARSRR